MYVLAYNSNNCYSIVELETSWEKETCIHVELENFIVFPICLGIVLYINRLFVINDTQIFLQLILITWYQSIEIYGLGFSRLINFGKVVEVYTDHVNLTTEFSRRSRRRLIPCCR